MNNHFQKVALRYAAATSLLVGFSIVACSSSEEPPVAPPPPPGVSGTTTNVGGTAASGGTASGGTGGSATAGTGGTSTAPVCTPACTAPKLSCVGAGGTTGTGVGTCSCPGYAPDFCEAANKCANFTKDPLYCGTCTTACGPTQACSNSACQPELTAVGAEIAGCGKLQLLAGNSKLYVLNTTAGSLSTFDGATGALTPVATALTGATAFAVDATHAYVVAGMKVIKVTLADGTKADFATETMPVYDVALDTDSVYWATDKPASDTDVAHMDFAGFVKKAVKATVPAVGVIVGGGMDLGQPQGVAVSGTNILYASYSAQNVEAQIAQPVGADPHTDVNHIKIGASQGSLIYGHRSVQVDGGYLYWVNGTLQRSHFTVADHMQETAANTSGMITSYAVTATTAYFASDTGAEDKKQSFEKSAFGAADPTWVARNLDPVSSIITDATSVYLASGCKILKTAL